jgi:carbonic anhydrase
MQMQTASVTPQPALIRILEPTIALCQTSPCGGCSAILANPCTSSHLTGLLTSNDRYEDSEVDDEEDEEEEEEEEEEGEGEEEDEDEGELPRILSSLTLS